MVTEVRTVLPAEVALLALGLPCPAVLPQLAQPLLAQALPRPAAELRHGGLPLLAPALPRPAVLRQGLRRRSRQRRSRRRDDV